MSVTGVVSDGSLLLAVPVAIAAGAVSFVSPCVLPLVPGYLGYVTGLSGADLAEETARRGRILIGTALFVLGFTAVFVSYGALFGRLGATLVLHQRVVDYVLGSVTILLGLAFAGALEWFPMLGREFRLHKLPAQGLVGAPVLGVLFGLGWTPCIGPTLGAVLGLAAESPTAGRGAFLGVAYCAGLGLPFLVTGLAYRRALGAFAAIKRHYRAVMMAGGGLLVVLGVLEVTGVWGSWLIDLQSFFSVSSPL